MDFLDSLGSVLSQQFQLGNSKLTTLDTMKDGHTIPYGRLGQFSSSFDQSAERSWTETGFSRNDPFNYNPKQLEIFMQEPDITVLVKKRAFSSLVDNYRLDFLEQDERNFLRATKFLFQNKCKQIGAYEKLTKLESVVQGIGSIDTHLLPLIFSLTDTLSILPIPGLDKFNKIVDRVKTIVNLSDNATNTSWITNQLDSFRTDLGEGTGVIEFTTMASVRTTSSTEFGRGGCSVTFNDPYKLMHITNNDIEQAIADAVNPNLGSSFSIGGLDTSFIQLGVDTLNSTIQLSTRDMNDLRTNRGANPIRFIINPDTFLGKRVRALIDFAGVEIIFTGDLIKVSVDTAFLEGSSPLGIDALRSDEADLFRSIVRSYFNINQITSNSRADYARHNETTNPIRKKLRSHYGGKYIIQPRDVVHIYIGSKTRVDNKILGGLQDSLSGQGFLQGANKALMNLEELFNISKSSSIEKAVFVGSDFPNFLWLILRNQFSTEKSGAHVFAGVVEKVTGRFDASSGTYSVSMDAKDNTAYFDWGVINFKPSLDVFNGSLYDPLTPFNIKFDSVTGTAKQDPPELLPENVQLFNSAFVKYKQGIYVGRQPTQNNFLQDAERIQNNSTRRVFYDPDGMVYKWKEGIGSLVMFGNNYQATPPDNQATPTFLTDPFAGQDIMNVLSLLITGEPYNYATFYKAASQFDNFGRDPLTGADPAASYFRHLQSDLKYRNLLYGNFIPFKSMSINPETGANIINNQLNVIAFDADLSDLIAKKAALDDQIRYLTRGNAQLTGGQNILEQEANSLSQQIDAKTTAIIQNLQKINKPMSIVGDDVTFDTNVFLNTPPKNKLSNVNNAYKEIQRKMQYLTRRLSWKVRANEDLNLFIVDDSYDRDFDIQAFEKSFVNPQLFRSTYDTVSSKIKTTADLLKLEVFANSQGHIEIRPPQYNRVPSSVFYRMLRLKDTSGIQVYPQFLEDLYINQIDSMLGRVGVLEDEIREYGVAIGKNTDSDLSAFINFSSAVSAPLPPSGNALPFAFVSDEDTGSVPQSSTFQNVLDQQIAPEKQLDMYLSSLDKTKSQATVNNVLSTVARANIFVTNSTLSSINVKDAILSNNTVAFNRFNNINDRLYKKTNQRFDLGQLFSNSNKLFSSTQLSSVDYLKFLQEIADRIAERQRLLKVVAAAIKNAKETLKFATNKSKLQVPNLFNNKEIPQVFSHMIEDESYDDYGPGAGQRYVIKDNHILSIEISEEPPPFTTIEVHGRFADNFIPNSALPSDLNAFNGDGNALVTAAATDYDLWRQYGLIATQAVEAPFLTNPDTQCAPYAVALLNKARQQVFRGSITIFGNEYMQPGEVVYIEDRDLLFYVTEVSHNFSYGRSFQTTLSVSYGHMPGDFIPTDTDVIGKVLYKNKDITNLVNKKQGNARSEEHIGSIILDPGSFDLGSLLSSGLTGNTGDGILSGRYSAQNRQTIINMIQAIQSSFSTATSSTYQPIIELRTYFNSKKTDFSSSSNSATDLANAVKDYITGKNTLSELTKDQKPQPWLVNFAANILTDARVIIDTATDPRSPSSKAYSLARQAILSQSTDQTDIKAIDQMIYDNVVDCWVVFTNPDTE